MRQLPELTPEEMAEIPEMTGNFVTDCHDLQRWLTEESQDLYGLSSAFRRTGNSEMAMEMIVLAKRLRNMGKRAGEICGHKVSGDLKQSEEMTGMIVGTMLRGVLDGTIDPSRRRPLPGENDLAETAEAT